MFDLAIAVWDAFYGNAAAARQRATTVLERARGRDVDYAAAFALALSGDVARARTIASDLDKDFPDGTSVQYLVLIERAGCGSGDSIAAHRLSL